MHPKKYKVRCTKQTIGKASGIISTYGDIQTAAVLWLEENKEIVSIECNVPFEDENLKDYVTDFLCKKKNGDYMVRECLYRKQIAFPKMCKQLDESRRYWRTHGITDWGIMVEEEV